MTATEVSHVARRAREIDVVLSAVTIVLVGVAVSADLGDGVGPGPVAYGFAIGPGGLLLVRRRFPVGVLVTTAAALLLYYRLGQPPIGLAVPMVAALFSAAEQGRTRWASSTAVALIVVSTSVRTTQGDGRSLPAGNASGKPRSGWHGSADQRAAPRGCVACGGHRERRSGQVTVRVSDDGGSAAGPWRPGGGSSGCGNGSS